MRIAEIVATPINIPLQAGYIWSVGVNRGFAKAIVQVFTDEGIIGYGEAQSDQHAKIIDELIAPRLIGRDPFDIADCETRCLSEWQSVRNLADDSAARAFGAVEIALWDIKAKAAGQPLSRLLGGAVRNEVKFTEYFGYRQRSELTRGENSIEDVVEYCLRQREAHGSTIFEGKVGFSNADNDIRMVTALREALGDEATIRLDANYGWTMSTARRVVRAIEPLNISNIEDPVLGYENMARLRQHTSIPFSTHEIDLPHAVSVGAPDAFVANIAALGGISATLRFAHACDIMGRDFWFYSGDTGIMTAAYIHLSAATRSIREPHQALLRWQTMDVIDGGVMLPRNNAIAVPKALGLGVTLNEDMLNACHDHYRTHGPCETITPPKDGHFHRLPRY